MVFASVWTRVFFIEWDGFSQTRTVFLIIFKNKLVDWSSHPPCPISLHVQPLSAGNMKYHFQALLNSNFNFKTLQVGSRSADGTRRAFAGDDVVILTRVRKPAIEMRNSWQRRYIYDGETDTWNRGSQIPSMTSRCQVFRGSPPTPEERTTQ
jgi:hypothetical protein